MAALAPRCPARVLLCRGLATAMLGGGLVGCKPLGASSAPSRVQQAQVSHEYHSAPPPHQQVVTASSSAREAVRQFARTYINWDADTITARLQGLARDSVGQARSAMQLAAAQAARDYELRRGGIANHGTVEAVAPLDRQGHRFAVVTREHTTATLSPAYQGLRPAWHVAVATVVPAPAGGWVVSRWQPEG